jgi:hypothetical protein
MTQQQFSFLIDADHYQFYVEDEAQQPDTSQLWDEQAFADRLDVLPGLIAVGTSRYGSDIPVIIEVAPNRPATLSFAEWDHVVECSIAARSGELALSSPVGPGIARFEIAPGTYRVIVLYGALDTARGPGDLDGDDHYHLVLWPEEQTIRPKVLKRKPYPPNVL